MTIKNTGDFTNQDALKHEEAAVSEDPQFQELSEEELSEEMLLNVVAAAGITNRSKLSSDNCTTDDCDDDGARTDGCTAPAANRPQDLARKPALGRTVLNNAFKVIRGTR